MPICLKTTSYFECSNEKLKNGKEKRVLVEYAKPIFNNKDLLKYNYLRMHERPNSVIVFYDYGLANMEPVT